MPPRKATFSPTAKKHLKSPTSLSESSRNAQASYAAEIRKLARQYAPPKPSAPSSGGHILTVGLCLGRGSSFDNIGRWFAACNATHRTNALPAERCTGFLRFLSEPLPELRLKVLHRLWVLHDNLGKQYSQDSPSQDLINHAFLSDDEGPASAPDSGPSFIPTRSKGKHGSRSLMLNFLQTATLTASGTSTHATPSLLRSEKRRRLSRSASPVQHKRTKKEIEEIIDLTAEDTDDEVEIVGFNVGPNQQCKKRSRHTQ